MGRRTTRKSKNTGSKRGRKPKGNPIPSKERQKKFHSLVEHFSGLMDWEGYDIDSVVKGLSRWLHEHNNGDEEQAAVGLKNLLERSETEFSISKDNAGTDSANVFESIDWVDLGVSGNILDEIVVLLVVGLHFFRHATEDNRKELQAKYGIFCRKHGLSEVRRVPKEWKRVFSFLMVVHHKLAPLRSGGGYKVAGEVLASLVLSERKYHAHSAQNMHKSYAVFHLMLEHISGRCTESKTTRIAKQRLKKFVEQKEGDEDESRSDAEDGESTINDLASLRDDGIDEALDSELFSGQSESDVARMSSGLSFASDTP